MMLTDQMIMDRIYVLRGQKVMVDADLASLYGMESKRIRLLVAKNPGRFPADFMFRLNAAELNSLQQQDTKTQRNALAKVRPLAFTEQGLAMLAGMLKTERAIEVNIRIIRIFTLIRQILPDYPELSKILDQFKVNLICHK